MMGFSQFSEHQGGPSVDLEIFCSCYIHCRVHQSFVSLLWPAHLMVLKSAKHQFQLQHFNKDMRKIMGMSQISACLFDLSF